MEKERTKEKTKEYALSNSELLKTCVRGLERNLTIIKTSDDTEEKERCFRVLDDYMIILNDLTSLIEDDEKNK